MYMKQLYSIKLTLFLVCCCPGLVLQAQNFHLVKDINALASSYPNNFSLNYTPRVFAVLNGVQYFVAGDDKHGNELWRSDGTPEGTIMVKDITPGTAGTSISNITAVGEKLLFCVFDATGTQQIWISNGTGAGTHLVKSIITTNAQISSKFVTANGVSYFLASGNIFYDQLWRTDGTAGGTKLVANFYTPEFNYGYAVDNLTSYKGKVYFSMQNNGGPDLWMSDGTVAGTHILNTKINSHTGGDTPGLLTVLDNKLYFAANDGSGYKIWQTEGDSASSKALPFSNGVRVNGMGYGQQFSVIKHTLYFSGNMAGEATYKLYKYDLDSSYGSVPVKDDHSGSQSFVSYIQAVNDSLVFFVDYDANRKQSLLATSNKDTGTTLLLQSAINNIDCFRNIVEINHEIYFTYYDANTGFEVWKSDGTVSGTKIVKDISPGLFSSSPTYITHSNGLTLLNANDGISGYELWKTDGTDDGTILVKNIKTRFTASSYALNYFGRSYSVLHDNELLFAATDDLYGEEIWKTDGSAEGTFLLKDIRPGILDGTQYPILLTAFKDVHYFFGRSDDLKLPLYKTKGTTVTTELLQSFPGIKNLPQEEDMVAGITHLFCKVFNNDSSYSSLYVIDTLNNVTQLKKGIHTPDDQNSAVIKDTLFFFTQGNNGPELWRSDGTVTGTTLVRSINPGAPDPRVSYMFAFKNKVYFLATDAIGKHLWVSNGTEAGTYMFLGLTMSGYPLVKSGDKFYFAAADADHGTELWVSNENAGNAKMVKDINPGDGSTNIDYMVDVNGILYFTADDGVHGNELWKSDGTEAGTSLVKDINVGAGGANLQYLVNANGLLYFTKDGELWQSDGSDTGTIAVIDENLNGLIGIANLVTAGDKLYFNATSMEYGMELYVGQASAILPVTLLSFNGSLVKNDALLKWTTINEIHNSYFNIQRSSNGAGFTTVGKVIAAGNATSTHDYDFTDANVTSLGVNALYYRLQQVDADGKSTYSNIIKLAIASVDGITISPNPAHKMAYIRSSTSISNALITVTDMNGHILYSTKQNIQAGSQIPVNISTLAAGTYNVTIQAAGITKRQMKLLLE